MLTVFLGAGLSRSGGVPLARQLFDSAPRVDRITRQHSVERVLDGWREWHTRTDGSPRSIWSNCNPRADGSARTPFGTSAW